jgi:hypothetical protein
MEKKEKLEYDNNKAKCRSIQEDKLNNKINKSQLIESLVLNKKIKRIEKTRNEENLITIKEKQIQEMEKEELRLLNNLKETNIYLD